jgi:hypothetical protein
LLFESEFFSSPACSLLKAHCGQAAKFISAPREKRWQMCAGRVFERKKGAGWGQAHIWLFLLPLAKCAYNCARANGANKLANNCQMHHSARRKPNLICRRTSRSDCLLLNVPHGREFFLVIFARVKMEK